jgi:dTDP-4-dehydrorhamnose 3,5-epimerase
MRKVGEPLMEKFKVIKTEFDGLLIIEPPVFGDDRGFFMEWFNAKDFKALGLDLEFVQDNHSHSQKGVLRGMHFQKRSPQTKLIRVTRGIVFDVVVDLRKSYKTFGKWFGIKLSDQNKKIFLIPVGFAHGFLTLSDDVDFMYKCTDFYNPDDEGGLRWDDPNINIKWPLEEVGDNLIISDKDKKWPYFKDLDFFFE